MEAIRILLVDDHALVREALAVQLANWVEFAAQATDALVPARRLTGVENALYLDDSGSMGGALLPIGKEVLGELASALDGAPTRVVKFGTDKTVLAPTSPALGARAPLLSALWDASSGTTVMWDMIEADCRSTWTPEGGKLRLYVLTDGHDSRTGMAGMHPMMDALLAAGFDIEVREREGCRSLCAR